MRMLLLAVVLLAVVTGGCAGRKPVSVSTGKPPAFATLDQKASLTPDTATAGRVIKINAAGRFVVLNYLVGHMPAMDQHYSLYRKGLKVGEVRVTGPQYDDNIVADVLEGDAEIGDEARER